MDDLNLFDDPEFNPALPRRATTTLATSLPELPAAAGSAAEPLPSEWLIATGLASQAEPVLESQAPGLMREKRDRQLHRGVAYLSDGVVLSDPDQFTSPDPDKAAVISNRIARAVHRGQIKGKLGATDKATGWLEQRLAELRGRGAEVRRGGRAVQDREQHRRGRRQPRSTSRSCPTSIVSWSTAQADLAGQAGEAAARPGHARLGGGPGIGRRGDHLADDRAAAPAADRAGAAGIRAAHALWRPPSADGPAQDEKAKVAAGIRDEVERRDAYAGERRSRGRDAGQRRSRRRSTG